MLLIPKLDQEDLQSAVFPTTTPIWDEQLSIDERMSRDKPEGSRPPFQALQSRCVQDEFLSLWIVDSLRPQGTNIAAGADGEGKSMRRGVGGAGQEGGIDTDLP